MPNVATVGAEGFASSVTNTPGKWTGTAAAAVPANSAAVNVNVSMMPVAGATAFYNGSYTIEYSAKDASGYPLVCTPSSASFIKTASTSSVNFSARISVPSNQFGTFLPSPLSISITLTNVGGGGGWEPQNG